jgi:hypothetical protein
MSSFVKRGLGSLSFVLAASVLLSSGCSATPKGALILAISTDMQTPKDISVISVFITTNGTPKFDYLGRVLPDGTVALPSTLAVVEPDTPDAQVRIRIIGFQEQNARVLRDVLTTVPHEQTSLLRLPLNFLDVGSGTGTIPANLVPLGAGGAPEGDTTFNAQQIASRCDFTKGLTSINGVCASATVVSSTLPAYTPSEVYGDAGLLVNGAPASCFAVETCFPAAMTVANLDSQMCTFPLPPGADPSTLNIAFVTPSTGACLPSGGCYVPLVNDPSDGWTLQGSTVKMPQGVCAKLGNGVTLAMSSGTCPTETASEPVCEPTTPAEVLEAGAAPLADAGASAPDATVGTDASTGGSCNGPYLLACPNCFCSETAADGGCAEYFSISPFVITVAGTQATVKGDSGATSFKSTRRPAG